MKLHEWTNPFGVVEMEGRDYGFSEKPVLEAMNAGVYALSPSVLEMLPRGSTATCPPYLRCCLAGSRLSPTRCMSLG